MCASRHASRFWQLGRFAPVAANSGLRPETHEHHHIAKPGRTGNNMEMLFKKKPEDQRRTSRIPVRVTMAEREKIVEAARIRALDVSEFMRRAALGRKADVKIAYDIIHELRAVTKAIRELHAAYLAIGETPPEDVLRPLMDEIVKAMKRVAL